MVTYVEDNTLGSQVAIAYVYCDYKEPKTEAEILSAIIRQLAEKCHPLPIEVKKFRENYMDKRMHPSNEERISIIRCMAQLFEKTYIFIDALVSSTYFFVHRSLNQITNYTIRTSARNKIEKAYFI